MRAVYPCTCQGVDDDEGWNAGGLEWTNNEFLHLRTKGLLSGPLSCSVWVCYL